MIVYYSYILHGNATVNVGGACKNSTQKTRAITAYVTGEYA